MPLPPDAGSVVSSRSDTATTVFSFFFGSTLSVSTGEAGLETFWFFFPEVSIIMSSLGGSAFTTAVGGRAVLCGAVSLSTSVLMGLIAKV